MDDAPKDGSRVLVQAVCYGFTADRTGFRSHKALGSRWVECRYVDDRWQEWLGKKDRHSAAVITPLAWRPLPC